MEIIKILLVGTGNVATQLAINLDIEKFNRLSKLIEALEDLDDVQNVYANFDIDNKLLEKAITG